MELNSLVRVYLSWSAWSLNMVPLLKSNTSSLKSYKILRTFSHFCWDCYAVWQISEMKLFQLTVHSCFTIDTKVPFNFVSKGPFAWLSSSDMSSTNWMMHYLIPYLCSSGKTYHRCYKIKINHHLSHSLNTLANRINNWLWFGYKNILIVIKLHLISI